MARPYHSTDSSSALIVPRKWRRRMVITVGVCAASLPAAFGLYHLDRYTNTSEKIIEELSPKIIGPLMGRIAAPSTPLSLRRHLLRFLAFLTEKEKELEGGEAIVDTLRELLLYNEPSIRALASLSLCSILKHDKASREAFVKKEYMRIYISPLIKLEERERNATRLLISEDSAMNTLSHLTNILLHLMSTGHTEAVIDQVAWKSLALLCSERAQDTESTRARKVINVIQNHENSKTPNRRSSAPSPPVLFAQALSPILADMTLGPKAKTLIEDGSIELMRNMVLLHHPQVLYDVARTIANLAQSDDLSHTLCRKGVLDILDAMMPFNPATTSHPYDHQDDLAITRQVARAIANLAHTEHNKEAIAREGWIQKMCLWLQNSANSSSTASSSPSSTSAIPASSRIDIQLSLSAIVGLGNLLFTTSSASEDLYIANKEVIVPSLIKLGQTLNELINQQDDGNDTLASTITLRQQLLRSIANMSKDQEVVPALFEYYDAPTVLRLVTDLSQDKKAMSFASRALGNMSLCPGISATMLNEDNWKAIKVLADHPDVAVQQQIARTVANLAINESEKIQKIKGAEALVNKWQKHDDRIVRSHATRAMSVFALTTAKYAEGIYLMYPDTPTYDKDFTCDVVMVHGVTGDPFLTWVAGETTPVENLDSVIVCWPRDWLPTDIPGIRVISVSYELFLSEWFGTAMPLKEQSKLVLENLKLAGVGTRPVVFITHSFGGLVVKQMLKTAHDKPEQFGALLKNTKGVVFFSTPHKGVAWTDLAIDPVNRFFFRGTHAISDLRSRQELASLNEEFMRFAPHVPTLSFGEGITCFGFAPNCWQIVSDESANPGYGELFAKQREELLTAQAAEIPSLHTSLLPEHSYFKTKADHINVCKPIDTSDPRYALTMEFIRNVLKNSSAVAHL